MSKEQLLAQIAAIESDQKNQNPPGSLWLFKKSARAKLDKLRREVVSLIRAEKLARGETVNDCGYSGRQTNRR
jgi:hypothetical protein